jgi:hypothetical protein
MNKNSTATSTITTIVAVIVFIAGVLPLYWGVHYLFADIVLPMAHAHNRLGAIIDAVISPASAVYMASLIVKAVFRQYSKKILFYVLAAFLIFILLIYGFTDYQKGDHFEILRLIISVLSALFAAYQAFIEDMTQQVRINHDRTKF